MTKRRALICACGLLLSVLAFRVFFIQELFFAFLFFALAYLLLFLVAAVVFCLLYLYTRGMSYLAVRISAQGQRVSPAFRVLVLWLAPTVTEIVEVLSVRQRILFYPFSRLLRVWSQSLRRDVFQFREDTERALKHLRLPLKHN
jgi:hypothetical protein